MKAAVAVASLVSLVGRCSGFELPDPTDDPWHDHDHHHAHQPSGELCDPPPSAADEDAGTVDPECGPPGLYRDHSFKQLATGVVPYTPSHELWADGADKDRFIFLPDDTQIDTSHPDRWTFPKDTRIYKTFSLNGVKLETRVFKKFKQEPGFDSWTVEAWAWSQDQRSARLASPDGEGNVLGTQHDIPSQSQCKTCHAQTGLDVANGFEAIQLNHAGSGWTLERLIGLRRLVNEAAAEPNVTLANARIPGDKVEQDGLGYLHANCGACHRGDTGGALKLDFRVAVGLGDVSEAPAYQLAANCAQLIKWKGPTSPDNVSIAPDHVEYKYVVDPGLALTSGVIGRMSIRASSNVAEKVGQRLSPDQMPKLGSELIDEDGVAKVSRFIDSLPHECP